MAEGGSSTQDLTKENLLKVDECRDSNTPKDSTSDGSSYLECAICLQSCIHPAQLPCGHIFCFLCVKGVVHQSKKCAMCRQDIPPDYLDKPVLVDQSLEKDSISFDDGYQWFYEGRNGWWQYDERTSRELETAYKKGERIYELLIAGSLYIADFDSMLQLRQNDPSKRRRIKRDLATIPKKGIAGLRLEGAQEQLDDSRRPKSPTTPVPIPPTNTPQTPSGGQVSGDTTPDRHLAVRHVIEHFRSLSIHDIVNTSESSDDEESGSGDENQDLPDFSSVLVGFLDEEQL